MCVCVAFVGGVAVFVYNGLAWCAGSEGRARRGERRCPARGEGLIDARGGLLSSD